MTNSDRVASLCRANHDVEASLCWRPRDAQQGNPTSREVHSKGQWSQGKPVYAGGLCVWKGSLTGREARCRIPTNTRGSRSMPEATCTTTEKPDDAGGRQQ